MAGKTYGLNLPSEEGPLSNSGAMPASGEYGHGPSAFSGAAGQQAVSSCGVPEGLSPANPKKRSRMLKTKKTADISPLFALPQYDASNLLGFPRSTFCRKWKQATATSEASLATAPSEFYEGPKQKKSKRQSLGKPQTVYRRWPFRRIKMIDERINSLIFNEGEPITGVTIDALVELFTEKTLLSEPVFFEIDSSLSSYVAPPPTHPATVLDACKQDEPLDINATIISLLSKVPPDVVSTFPVPYPENATQQQLHSASHGSINSMPGSRIPLFDPTASQHHRLSSISGPIGDSFFATLLSSIEPTQS